MALCHHRPQSSADFCMCDSGTDDGAGVHRPDEERIRRMPTDLAPIIRAANTVSSNVRAVHAGQSINLCNLKFLSPERAQ